MKRPNRLDWLIYSLFRLWWNPIFAKHPGLVMGIEKEFKGWLIRNGHYTIEDRKDTPNK